MPASLFPSRKFLQVGLGITPNSLIDPITRQISGRLSVCGFTFFSTFGSFAPHTTLDYSIFGAFGGTRAGCVSELLDRNTIVTGSKRVICGRCGRKRNTFLCFCLKLFWEWEVLNDFYVPRI